MIKPLMFIVALASAALPAVGQNAAPAKLNTSGALFGVRESVQQMDISPDGTRVVYITPGPGRSTAVYTADLAGGVPQEVMKSGGKAERLSWCKFASDKRLICQILAFTENQQGTALWITRLLAVDIDGKNGASLDQRRSSSDERMRQFGGTVLDWLPDENGAVLMSRDYVPETKNDTRLVRKDDGLGIDRIDVTTMEVTKVEGAAKAVDFFMSDGRGAVRMKSFTPLRGVNFQMSSRTEYNYRLPGSRDWKPFSSWDDDTRLGMIPLDIDAETNSAYVVKTLDGRLALYRVKLDGSLASELVYKNDKVDVDGVFRVGRGARIVGVTFAEEKRGVVYFDAEYKRLAASLGKAIPNLPLVDFLAASRDGNKLLIHAGSDSDPGRYFVYEKTTRTLNEIMLARPALENIKLASVKPISYPARDGTPIPGYLTLPPGKESARGLPAVILPHGGPSSRDEWGFDWLAQYFAHEGYAVLQPNYRGSSGYGEAWMEQQGFRSWKTSIGDVTDAAHWLTAQGIADPGKLAIVGWSYGGYAALQSGVTEPGLFKAIVAIAPVTDLALLKLQSQGYTSSRRTLEMIGSGPHIQQGSPLQNVEKFNVPVLMFHGSKDLNVGVEHSQKMDAKLRGAGKTSELVVYEGLEHSLVDSNARALMLDRIGAFLKANLGN